MFNMTSKLFVILLLGASVYAMPKSMNLNKDELKAVEVKSLLLPGPVLLPGSKAVPSKTSSSSQDYQCVLCEFVVKEIDSMLKQNSTEQEIKATLDRLCSDLPAEESAECKKFVDEYVEPIIESLATMDPKMVCTELGLCKTMHKELKVRVGASPQCQLCELLAKELDTLITENSTQEEIEEALKQACNILPSSYKVECDSLVQEYTPVILDALANEISPTMFCSTIGLCSSSMGLEVGSSVGNGTEMCDICLKLLGIAKKLVEDNATQSDVEKVLKLICWYMLPVKTECDDFVDKIVPLVFDELKKLDPDTICKQLKLCPSDFTPNDVRCFLTGINHCESPDLVKQCGTEAYCKDLLLGTQ